MPSLRSFGPTTKPGSSACTTNAEMPLDFFAASGSVTAITVYQLDTPALVIQHLVPFEHPVVAVEAGPGPHRRGVRAGLPLGQRVADHRLARRDGRQHLLLELLRRRTAGSASVPSLFTAGISDDDAQTRATSSITMHVATASAPWPSYSSGIVHGRETRLASAFSASTG